MAERTVEATEQVGDIACEIGESPIWDERFGVLRWVDIRAGKIHSYNPASGQLPSIQLNQQIGFIVPFGSEELLGGLPLGLAAIGLAGEIAYKCSIDADRPRMRMNDGKADPEGRLWAGRMSADEPKPEGGLYRIQRDWTVDTQLARLTIPNGIGWSPDVSVMYFTDTTWDRIDSFSYDIATGQIADRRTFVEIPPEHGHPDGFTVDEDGCLWVALWCGAAVHRYTPEGHLDTIVRVPALQTTSCVFGGPDRRHLFITSARYRLTGTEAVSHPRSGLVFVCEPGSAGLQTDPFISLDSR